MNEFTVKHIKYCTGCGARPCMVLNIIDDADHLPPCGNEGEKWYYVTIGSCRTSTRLAEELKNAIEEHGSTLYLDRTVEDHR